jgi:ribosomal protein L40E
MPITRKGYSRIYDPVTRRLRMEHDLVWERANGPIPAGFVVHHINHDKLDNRIENLQLLDPLTHKRHHSGCEQRDGIWWKPCRKCGVVKPVSEYYAQQSWISPWCRSCQIENAVRNKRKRRAVRQQRLLFEGRQGKVATLEATGEKFNAIEPHEVAA